MAYFGILKSKDVTFSQYHHMQLHKTFINVAFLLSRRIPNPKDISNGWLYQTSLVGKRYFWHYDLWMYFKRQVLVTLCHNFFFKCLQRWLDPEFSKETNHYCTVVMLGSWGSQCTPTLVLVCIGITTRLHFTVHFRQLPSITTMLEKLNLFNDRIPS